MNEQNLVPFKSVEEAREKGRKGGLSRSPKKSLMAKLRWLKIKGLTEENAKQLYESMMDSEFSELDIKSFLDKIRDESKDIKSQREAAKLLLEWHKVRHGSAEKKESANVNVNVVDTLKQFFVDVIPLNDMNNFVEFGENEKRKKKIVEIKDSFPI